MVKSFRLHPDGCIELACFLCRGKVLAVSHGTVHQLEGLSGPTYRLGSKIHQLPPLKALKVFMPLKSDFCQFQITNFIYC